jgi:hypothetical protein
MKEAVLRRIAFFICDLGKYLDLNRDLYEMKLVELFLSSAIRMDEKVIGEITNMHSTNTATVFDVTSWQFLDRVIQKTRYKDVRGILTDDSLHIWDAEMAAHGAYERMFGHGGSRVMVQGADGLYNVSYYTREETPEDIKQSPIFQRLFTPEMLQRMIFDTMDDFTD